jgi:hypothetical protein
MFQIQAHLGRGFACLGGLLAIFSFVSMSWFSLGFLGSFTALQIAQFANPEFQTLPLSYLWLALLLAGASLILSIIGCFIHTMEPGLSITLIILGLFALFGMMSIYVFLSQQRVFGIPLTTFLGSGFWFYAFSVALVAIGGRVQLTILRRRQRASYYTHTSP